MGQWYDEDMPGQECPYSRDHRIMMENYFKNTDQNEIDNNVSERESSYDTMYKNLLAGKNAHGSEIKPEIAVEAGSLWMHHNGITYQVICIANKDSTNTDYPETVVYKGGNGKIWAKTTKNFLEKMSKR